MIMWQELQPDDPGRIGPYRLRGVLGSGGMGRVFLGASVDGELAAVKVIRADLASDPEFRARFRREVTVARKVSSRFTAPLIGADTDGPMPWLATAYVTGPSLADAVTQHGPLPVRSVRELVAGLATGLSAIHAAGVVHRDLKPSNVLLAQDGPRVIDFGISVAAETSPLTRTGLLIGSPGYMSPEQIEGREVGPASDIFSLGAVLAYAATGEAPFGRGSAPTLAYRAVYRQVNLDRVPAEVRGLIERCLAKDPGQRPTARDLEFAAGASVIPPTERWLPEPVTRTSIALPGTDKSSQTVTSARLSPASPPAPGRRGRHGSRRQRRLARPLTIASMVVGLLAASAAGGIALAASVHQTPGAHSGQAVSGSVTSPATSAPATSAASTPATMAPSTSATAPASAGATPTASPSAVMSPSASPTASAAGTPTASSSPAPTAPASASTSPAPSGSAVPSGTAAPSGAAVTPAS
jgi:eukaryotic-like serine/threonine-protein kinase